MKTVGLRVSVLMVVVVALLVAIPATFAQSGLNPWGVPTCGSVSLSAGFSPIRLLWR